MSDTKDPRLNLVLTAVMGKKALDIIVLDVSGLTSLADSFIICSGRSNRQVTAIADYIEGLQEGHWVLMDYGDIVIHVFYDDVRRFYDLEGLWSDAPRIRTRALDDWNHRQIHQDAPTD